MKRFTDAGRSCLESGNLYGALSLALMLPDICASLEDPGPGKSKLRYERWCKKWIEPLHMHQAANGNPSEPFLPASDCYQLRCSLIHSGAGDVAEGKQQDIDHFAFFDDTYGGHYNYVGGNIVNGVKERRFLQLNARKFSDEMYDAVDRWAESTKGDTKVQSETAKLLTIHAAGKVLGGVQFGTATTKL